MARSGWFKAALLGALLWFGAASFAQAGGVVSLNLCTDQWLMLLAPERIAGLTQLARDPMISPLAQMARHFPSARPDTETILGLHPDLVVAERWGAQPIVQQLRARGMPVLVVDEPNNFTGIEALMLRFGQELGALPRAAQLREALRARLRAVPNLGAGKTAIFWQARGLTLGPETAGAALLTSLGYRNLGLGGSLSLEALLSLHPDLVLVDQAPLMPSLASEMLAHPALKSLHMRAISPALLSCAGPWTLDLIGQISS